MEINRQLIVMEVMMNCSKCIFGKEIDEETTKCCNLHSDEYGQKLFTKYDGCADGKASTFGISEVEKRSLYNMLN